MVKLRINAAGILKVNVIVKNGGKIVVGPSRYLEMTVTNTFLVDSTSSVVANAQASGAGNAPVYPYGDWIAGGGGAGYGGNGGQGDGWYGGGGPGGPSYGEPSSGGALTGSRGADGKYGGRGPGGGGGTGGSGGGRIIVRAGTIQVDGAIQANGGNGGTYQSGGGGGSGGGITLSGDRVTLSGSVTANGGDGGPGGYGGGGGAGGRITVLYGALDNTGTVSANGGSGGVSYPSWWPKRGKGENGQRGSVVFIYVDKLPPTTTATPSGTPGLNGWYISEVRVTLSAADNPGGTGVARTEYSLDGITWSPYTAPFTLASEGITTILYRSVDYAGNVETTKTQTIKIDKTPPTITGAPTTSPNANGWYCTDVVVHFAATDAISGLASVTPDVTVTNEGPGQLIGGTATDQAGNTASASVTLNIDKTPPVLSVLSPTDGPYLTSDFITVTYSATDGLSGIDTVYATLDGTAVSNGQAINLSAMAGSHVFSVVTRDRAGNEKTISLTLVVLIAAEVEVEPDTLNVASRSDRNAVTVYLEVPKSYDANLIDVSTVKMEVNGTILSAQATPTVVGEEDDEDSDSSPEERKVKFDRQALINALGSRTGEITVIVSGQLSDGRSFVGSDMLRVISRGKAK